jgi:hypothetical protein
MARPYRAAGIGASVTWADGPGWYGARRWRWGGWNGARVFQPAFGFVVGGQECPPSVVVQEGSAPLALGAPGGSMQRGLGVCPERAMQCRAAMGFLVGRRAVTVEPFTGIMRSLPAPDRTVRSSGPAAEPTRLMLRRACCRGMGRAANREVEAAFPKLGFHDTLMRLAKDYGGSTLVGGIKVTPCIVKWWPRSWWRNPVGTSDHSARCCGSVGRFRRS